MKNIQLINALSLIWDCLGISIAYKYRVTTQIRNLSLISYMLVALALPSWAMAGDCLDLLPRLRLLKSVQLTEEIPLLEEKVATFPDLDPRAAITITYNRVVEVPYAKNQCSAACSYNSAAAYLEALRRQFGLVAR